MVASKENEKASASAVTMDAKVVSLVAMLDDVYGPVSMMVHTSVDCLAVDLAAWWVATKGVVSAGGMAVNWVECWADKKAARLVDSLVA